MPSVKLYQESRKEYLEDKVNKVSQKVGKFQNYVLDGVNFRPFEAPRSFGNVRKELERLQKKQFNLEEKLFKLNCKII